MFYHVVPAIHRRCFRLAVGALTFSLTLPFPNLGHQASDASEVAPLFRERWDSEDFCRQIERPFRWSDPAEVKHLLLYGYHNVYAD